MRGMAILNKELPTGTLTVILALCYCASVVIYERHLSRTTARALEEHARVIASSVWDMALTNDVEYLHAAAHRFGYKKIKVTDEAGDILYTADIDLGRGLDGPLEKMQLIRTVTLNAPVTYQGQRIGQITVAWSNRAIYHYGAALLLYALLLLIIKFHNRVIGTGRMLESKVAQRTEELAAANAALRESQERYRTLIDKANSIILRWKPDGTITFLNEFGLRFFKFGESELIGRNVMGTIVPETETTGRDLAKMIEDISRNPEKYDNNENENMRSDGGRAWVSWTNRPLRDDSGAVVEILSIGIDVTGRRLAEERLQRSESLLKEAQQISHIGNWTTNLQTGKTFWSDEFFRILGYEPSTIAPSFALFQKHIHPDDAHILMQRQGIAINDAPAFDTVEYRVIREDGALRNLLTKTVIISDDAGRPVQIHGIVQDVTEQKLAEQTLRSSREDLENALKFQENIFQTSIDGLIATDTKGYIIRANSAALNILGYTREELTGMHMAQLGPREEPYQSIAIHIMTTMREKGSIHDFATSLARKDGSLCPVEFNGAYLINEQGDRSGAVVSIKDITERKHAEAALRESEERFRALAETSPDAIYTTDENMIVIFWNAGAEKLFSYPSAEMLGQSATRLVPPAQILRHERNKAQLIETGASPAFKNPVESVAIKKGGSEFPIEVTMTTWRLNEKNYYSMIVRDITERKRAENELRASRDFLATIFKASPDIIIATDSQGAISMVSDNVERLFGYTSEELIGQSTAILTPDDDAGRQRVLNMMGEFLDRGCVDNYELPWRRKDGTLVSVEWNGRLLKNALGELTGSVAIVRDISQRKIMETQLRQSQKMESIGTLAGGIAHDFNNILTAIIGYTEMNLLQAPDDSRVCYNSENVLKAANRARDLVKQILTFSRPGDEERKPMHAGPIVKEAMKLLRASLPSTIDVQYCLTSEAYLLASPTQIHQIVINLCTNAYHALQEKGGTLSVLLEDTDLDEAAAAARTGLKSGRHVRLTVRDTGTGIESDIIHRIFDPFFTTKETGKGSGMGLAMVYGIVTSYGGAVEVESTPGQGSTFTVHIPVLEVAREEKAQEPEPEAPTGSERILFVDDETIIVAIARELLGTLGYSVVTADDPRHALEVFSENPNGYDLVISDYSMPHMNGFDLAKKILKMRPGMPIILCTGFSENITAEKALAAGIGAFVMKPLNRMELARTIREALDREAA